MPTRREGPPRGEQRARAGAIREQRLQQSLEAHGSAELLERLEMVRREMEARGMQGGTTQ